MKDIEMLLNKYFEGETTSEEERELRHFFTGGLVPDHLQVYRPMFSYFETEHTKFSEPIVETFTHRKKTKTRRKYITYSSGIAAVILLLLGITGTFRELAPSPTNYVVIDGKRYTDAAFVHKQAVAAFREVSLSEEDVFNTLFEDEE